jgi:hypothetical protein
MVKKKTVVKTDSELGKGLRSIGQLHRLIKKSKVSPYKTWEEQHNNPFQLKQA